MFGALKAKLGKALHIFSKKVEEESEVVAEENSATLVEEVIKKPKPKPKEKKKEPKLKKEVVKEKKVEKTKEKSVEKPKPPPKVQEKVKEEIEPESKEEVIEKPKEKKRFLGIFKRKEKPVEVEEVKEKVKEEIEPEPKEEKKSFFKKPLIRISISEKKFEELFWDIELALLENNVAVEVIEKLKTDLKDNILNQKLNAFALQKKIQETFRKSISELFELEQIDLLKEIKQKKPYVIAFIGVNGSGKTTSLAKLAYLLKEKNLSIVIAACDTFRAAALQQIEEHSNNLGVKLIKHDYGCDAAAVAFDAIKHAESKSIDVVLIDTAGRSHSNINLMDELKKVIRVSKPDLKIFVGDSLTGNDAVEQAKSFDEAVGIDAIILSKMDIDEKGGASISVSYVTKKPIIFTGTGQNYEDLKEFDKEVIIKSLEL